MSLRQLLAFMACFIAATGTAVANNSFAGKAPDYAIAPAADWVEMLELSDASESQSDEPTEYLLADTQIHVEGKQQVLFKRYAFRLNQFSSVENNSDIQLRFSPDYEKLRIHAVNIVRDGTVIDQLKGSEIKIVAVEDRQSNNLYSGQVDAVLLLKDVRIGDTLDYSFSIEGKNPVFEQEFVHFAQFGWGVPISVRNFRILIDKDRKLIHQNINGDIEVAVEQIGNLHEYRVRLSDLPEYTVEEEYPGWYTPFPYVQFSEYESWDQVGNWAISLFEIEGKPNRELQGYIDELKSIDTETAIEKAIAFVQNDIRYLGLEIGENSHRPHHPNEVFDNRYGDCKDKSLLLTTILNELGVEAWPALVSSTERNHLTEYLVSPNLFDHAIVSLRHEDKTYWVDPTVNYQGKGLETLHQYDYGKALVVKPGVDSLSEAKPENSVVDAISVEETLWTVDYFSPVQWTIETTYSGREAERFRSRLARYGKQETERQYLKYYAGQYPKIRRIEDLEVIDDPASNTTRVTETYLVPDYWEIENGAAYFEIYTDVLQDYVKKPKTVQRSQPLALYAHIDVYHKKTVMLPEHVDFSTEQHDVVFEDDFIHFHSEMRYDLRRLTLENRYRTKAYWIPAEATEDHIAMLAQIREHLGYTNSITNVEKDSGIAEVKALMRTLNNQLGNR